jgi:hypothetical protein
VNPYPLRTSPNGRKRLAYPPTRPLLPLSPTARYPSRLFSFTRFVFTVHAVRVPALLPVPVFLFPFASSGATRRVARSCCSPTRVLPRLSRSLSASCSLAAGGALVSHRLRARLPALPVFVASCAVLVVSVSILPFARRVRAGDGRLPAPLTAPLAPLGALTRGRDAGTPKIPPRTPQAAR